MDIWDHPGNLGGVRGTLLTIHHADWPAYPQGDDFHTPLLQLTAFPPGTEFEVIDDIDQSVLLVADIPGKKRDDRYDPKLFHVAIWHEDLCELRSRELIEGGESVSLKESHEHLMSLLRKDSPDGTTIGYKDPEGKFIPLPEPDFSDFDDEIRNHAIPHGRRVSVTRTGRAFLLAKLRSEFASIEDFVTERVRHLYELTYYDTAIRDACAQLETEIKAYTGSQSWGDRLTEELVSKLRDEDKILESYVRVLRQELRTVFKFIRNDYMHNLRDADEASAFAILFRIARVRSALKFVST